MRKDIKAIAFDIGGVLQLSQKTRLTPKKLHISGVHEYIAKKLKISLDQYFDAIDSLYVKSIEGKITKKELLKKLSKNLEISSTKLEKLYLDIYKKKFKVNMQLFKQAFKLKKRGYKIAILSDQWHLSKDPLMPKNLIKKFDVSVVSCEVGIRKPNPQIYKLLIKRLKLKPKEILFIDNQKWN